MSELLQQIIPLVPAYAWPIIIVVLGGLFIYRKIGNERKITAEKRDTEHDDMDKRVTLVEHDVQFIKEQNNIFGNKLDKILDELTSIKVELAKKEDK